jgi:hypothetical protein
MLVASVSLQSWGAFWPAYMPKAIQLINKTGKPLLLNVCIPCRHGGMLMGEKMPLFDVAAHYDIQVFDFQAWFNKELKDKTALERCLLPSEEELAWDVASFRLSIVTGGMVLSGVVGALALLYNFSANPQIQMVFQDTTFLGVAVAASGVITGLVSLYFFTVAKKKYLELPVRMGIQIIDPSKTICKTYLSDDSIDRPCVMVDCTKSPDKMVDTGFLEIAPGFAGDHKYILKIMQGVLRIIDQRGQILQPIVPR